MKKKVELLVLASSTIVWNGTQNLSNRRSARLGGGGSKTGACCQHGRKNHWHKTALTGFVRLATAERKTIRILKDLKHHLLSQTLGDSRQVGDTNWHLDQCTQNLLSQVLFILKVQGCSTGCVCQSARGRYSIQPVTASLPRSGELRTQKLKSHLVRTQSLNVLPLKLE